MDKELIALLAAWFGEDLGPERQAALLDRLKNDADFRRQFVEEIHMHGMLKAVQSAEPRWLQLEEELGWSADEESFEDRVDRELPVGPLRLWGAADWAVKLAATVVLCVLAFRGFVSLGDRGEGTPVAVAMRVRDVMWAWNSSERPIEGAAVRPGHLRLRSGELTLAFRNGVVLRLHGPADLDLLTVDRVTCREGSLRTIVPKGAEGFLVQTPQSAVVDLGTEFGVDVQKGGKTTVHVFQGKAEVALVDRQGRPTRSRLLLADATADVDPSAGQIMPAEEDADSFPESPVLEIPPLVFSGDYIQAVMKEKPWGYWRFDAVQDGKLASRVPGAPVLEMHGNVEFVTSNTVPCAVFPDPDKAGYILSNGPWTPRPNQDFALECWAASAAATPGGLLALLSPMGDGALGHSAMLQFNMDFARRTSGALRFLYRSPPGNQGGLNIYSPDSLSPYRWYHIVAQRVGQKVELYLNGAKVQEAALGPRDIAHPSHLIVGKPNATPFPERQFAGRIADVALYNKALSPEAIRAHAALRH
jgi:hypothetical protein